MSDSVNCIYFNQIFKPNLLLFFIRIQNTNKNSLKEKKSIIIVYFLYSKGHSEFLFTTHFL